ncbi:EAL domain-containing protein [Vibrio sp. SCSIO 43136]|uniref:EAL domain-containing protein n=1 Tax=Vibrio sp. SCSIO 43136 TaxID=2819101 RepID=UPI0020752A1B|nr:EAL domain-containing protein [Vibrio sp. SCSIO 43136]USD66757.1 EAL domain-containing protein [Vibrio sp. SCSIO 43136]
MALSDFERFKNCITKTSFGEYRANYSGFRLRSVFQPIFNAEHSVVGVEALVRIKDERNCYVRPDLFFLGNDYSSRLKAAVEALSRTLHILNFSQSEYRDKKLFLNLLPDPDQNAFHVDETNSTAEYLQQLDVNSQQFVMEVVEQEVKDHSVLDKVKRTIHHYGCELAVDDYGAEASTEFRVKQLSPQIVKLDRSILSQFMSGCFEPMTTALQVAKDVGARTVVEGIETQEQFECMCKLGIDMYQGYFLAHPHSIQPQLKPLQLRIA